MKCAGRHSSGSFSLLLPFQLLKFCGLTLLRLLQSLWSSSN